MHRRARPKKNVMRDKEKELERERERERAHVGEREEK